MKNLSYFFVVALALLCTQAVIPNHSRAEEPKFPYTGEFNGPYLFRSGNARMPDNQKGVIKFVIGADGKIKGEAHNHTLNAITPVTGTINEDGDFEATATATGMAVTFKGTLAKTKKGHVKGVVNQTSGKLFLGSVEMDLAGK